MHEKNHYTIDNIDDDEVLLGTVHKHPFGIAILYAQAIFAVIVSLGLAFLLLPTVFSDNETAFAFATIFAMLAVFFAVAIMLAATMIYRQSLIIITDKNITQILQGGIFRRKVSQLTMANVEDVTSEQRGFFSSMFNFGTLKIETAGEQMNFHFTYCPRPGYWAKVILEAREQFTSRNYMHTIPSHHTTSHKK